MSRWEPQLPPGGPLELRGRGTTFIRDFGPRDAPVVFLLHGWTATADLNWITSYEALSQRFRVVAMDHRGHGRGIRSRRAFRLADCADDVAAVADELGIDKFTPVGYSMGGPISMLTWHRHRDRVEGLVLCATAPAFGTRPGERAMFSMLPVLRASAAISPVALRRRIAYTLLSDRVDESPIGSWVAGEIGRSDPNKVLEAGMSLRRFDSRRWLHEIDVPTTVVRTTLDNAVPPAHQSTLVKYIPGATVIDAEADHSCVITDAPAFVPPLVRACTHVTNTAATNRRATTPNPSSTTTY